jgi:putative holliday junction resolvase
MRIMGLDYGERRIGVAVSDATGTIARPLEILTVGTPQEAVPLLRKIIAEEEVGGIVVGLPLHMDGSEGAASHAVRQFAAMLERDLVLPVELQDERLTTIRAERAMLEADMSRAKRAKRRDTMAAQFILQTYLERRRSRPSESQS